MPSINIQTSQGTKTINFTGNPPTPQDIDQISQQNGWQSAQQSGGPPSPSPSPTTTQPPSVTTGIGQELVGGLKGAVNTAQGLSNLGQQALGQTVGRAVNFAMGKGNTPAPVAASPLPKAASTPSNTFQKVGFGAEQVGEFLAPGGAEEDAAKATGKVLEEAPKIVQTAAKLGTKALTSAATMAGLTSAQEGSTKDIKQSATIGGALSLLSAPIQKLIEKVPETAWGSILKRTPAVVVKNPDLEADAAKTGLVGMTRQSILDKAGSEITNIETSLDSIIKQAKGDISTSKLSEYVKPLRDAYSRIPGEEGSVKAIDGVLESLQNKGEKISVQDAQQLKKDIYQHIAKSYGKGLMEISPITEAQKQIARGLKTEIQNIVPEIKGLNEKWAVYNGIQEAIDKTLARQTGKGVAGTGVGLYDLLTAGIGESAFGPVGGLLGGAASKAVASPAVLSGVSKLVTYFNDLPPTSKMMFYNGLKGIISQGVKQLSTSTSPK